MTVKELKKALEFFDEGIDIVTPSTSDQTTVQTMNVVDNVYQLIDKTGDMAVVLTF